MDFDSTISWELILGFIVALIGIFQLQSIRKQLKAGFFSEYTKRYQEIVLNFPENVNDKDFNISEMSKEDRDKFMRYVRVYFDLCSEEDGSI